ncbi:MAG TPA: sulfotransferase, partial [Sphingomicrobium sp.]|nr:sulfotransferase [Sphingomicrobium sp.]
SRPSDLKIASDLAAALAAIGQFGRALEVASLELAVFDPTLQLARIRGAVAVQAGDFAAAIEALNHVLASAPNDWESWNNLGNALRETGDFEGSADAFERALVINPQSPETRMNYATVLRELRRTDEAEGLLRELANEFPDSPLPLRDLHLLLKDARRDEEAFETIEAAVERDPENVSMLVDKANHLASVQNMAEAEVVYRKALEIDPLSATAFVGLALVLELTNRTSELAPLADEAEKRGVVEAANFVRAYHYRRVKQFELGLAALADVSDDLESARQLHLQGQLLEGAERYDEAFEAFSEMNALFRKDTSMPEERAAAYRDTIRYFRDTVSEAWVQSWRTEAKLDGRPAPVFLVGFPRSGTTLLDTILMSHPQIEVLEEEPALRTAMDAFSSFKGLPVVSDSEIEAARNLYFDTVASLNSRASGKLLIDKNPLTMNLLPFAARLFPDARVILALRHPCDVALSCFMANFRLNEGMSSFTSLEKTAELYDLSFGYFEHVQRLMPMPVHVIRYESIVEDRETELRGLFDFLGLDWHDAVLDHQSTALGRGRIKTASYAQVVEPIYTRSAGRWQKYRKHLEPILPVLAPWAEKFGYPM